MYKAYKYRIYPTKEQMAKIDHSIAVCRLVYNLALEIKIYAYKTQGVKLTAFDLCYQLIDLKNEYKWISEVDSQALQASVKKVDVAFKNFFNGKGYPKFKSRRSSQSFQCPNSIRKVDWIKSTLSIPKIFNIPIVLSRTFGGKIKTVTISKTKTGKYFASILVDTSFIEILPTEIKANTTIGIDTGIKSFAITSDGRTFEANRKLKADLQRLKCLHRRASKKKKGSSNQKKAYKQIAILNERISNKRLDYIHKTTSKLVHDNQVKTICIEDLNVAGMIKNHKVAQAMSDVSLGKFYEILGYKCKWYGVNLIKINRFAPSSKRCSECGSIKEKLSLSERNWTCENCGTTHDRDENAAENIKHYGLETIFNNHTPMGSRGEPVELPSLEGVVKQEK